MKKLFLCSIVGPRDILQVAARNDILVQRGLHDIQIAPHGLGSSLPKLQEYVIVAGRSQNTGFGKPHLRNQLEVSRNRSDPAGYLRIPVTSLFAELHRFAVLFRIQEELALANKASIPAYLMQEIVYPEDLLGRVRWAGLLTITERRISYPYLLWNIVWNDLAVIYDLGEKQR